MKRRVAVVLGGFFVLGLLLSLLPPERQLPERIGSVQAMANSDELFIFVEIERPKRLAGTITAKPVRVERRRLGVSVISSALATARHFASELPQGACLHENLGRLSSTTGGISLVMFSGLQFHWDGTRLAPSTLPVVPTSAESVEAHTAAAGWRVLFAKTHFLLAMNGGNSNPTSRTFDWNGTKLELDLLFGNAAEPELVLRIGQGRTILLEKLRPADR